MADKVGGEGGLTRQGTVKLGATGAVLTKQDAFRRRTQNLPLMQFPLFVGVQGVRGCTHKVYAAVCGNPGSSVGF